MITVTHDFKLKPNPSQVQMIETYLETCRKVYNYALRERKDWGQKSLSERIHRCAACLYTTNRDIAASQVVRNRGLVAVGQPVNGS